jgi:hypothetical protein
MAGLASSLCFVELRKLHLRIESPRFPRLDGHIHATRDVVAQNLLFNRKGNEDAGE